jgi:hypothetical protein
VVVGAITTPEVYPVVPLPYDRRRTPTGQRIEDNECTRCGAPALDGSEYCGPHDADAKARYAKSMGEEARGMEASRAVRQLRPQATRHGAPSAPMPDAARSAQERRSERRV